MIISTTSIVIMSIATGLVFLFILFLIIGLKYKDYIVPLDDKSYPFCALYGVGFAILALVRHDYASKNERKRKQYIALLMGEQHAEYYLRVNAAQRVTFAFLLLVIGFSIYGFIEDYLVVGVFVMFAFTAYYYVSDSPRNKINAKANKMLNDFADVVSKLALLVNAGMILREAWEKVSYTGDSELYKEMQLAVQNMNNGISELDAYTEFGNRCMAPEIKKFTSTIVQGLVKGNRELVEMIKQQSREIWDSKRHRVKQQGEKAASKLLIPICIMFIGILIMVIIPIFANLGV